METKNGTEIKFMKPIDRIGIDLSIVYRDKDNPKESFGIWSQLEMEDLLELKKTIDKVVINNQDYIEYHKERINN